VTRWFQTKLAALLVVAAACCIAGGWQAEAQGPGDDDDSRVPGVAWTTAPATGRPPCLTTPRRTPISAGGGGVTVRHPVQVTVPTLWSDNVTS